MRKISIAMVADNNYAPLVSVVIASVCFNTKSNCIFYIINSNITNERKKKIENLKNTFKNFEVEFIDVSPNEFFKNSKQSYSYWPSDVLLKMALPEITKVKDKLLYLDCDIIVQNDILELYEKDLENKIIGAVPQISDDKRNQALNINKNHKYFNSGIFLIDCEKWKEEKCLEKIQNLFIENQNNLKYPDQDLLNKYFELNYKELEIKFNLTNEYLDYDYKLTKEKKEEAIEGIKNNVIRHFEGGPKPWLFNFFKQNGFNKFWFYAKMTDFYDILATEFMINNIREIPSKNEIKKIKLLNIFVLFSVCKINPKKTVIKLFNIIPIITIKK